MPTYPGYGPLDPFKTSLLPPLRDAVLTPETGGLASRNYQRWFLDLQRRLDTIGTVITGTHDQRPEPGSVPVGTIFWDQTYTVFFVLEADGWHYAAGICSTQPGDIPIVGTVTPTTGGGSGGGPVSPGTPSPHPTPPTPPAETLAHQGLIVDRTVFRYTSDSSVAYELGTTAFSMLQYWLDGETAQVDAFTNWMVASGLRVARVLGMFGWDLGGRGPFIPQSYGMSTYWLGISALCDYLAGKNLRLHFTVLADLGYDTLADIDRVGHVLAAGAMLAGRWNAMLSGGNEFDVTMNGWDPTVLSRPTGVLASRGSAGWGGEPPENGWDFFDFHPRRVASFPRETKNIYDWQVATDAPYNLYMPGVSDETMGLGEVADGRTTTDADDVFDSVACPFGQMFFFHVRSGFTLEVPGPIAQACVDAGVEAAGYIPPEIRDADIGYGRGDPTHPTLPIEDCPYDSNNVPQWWDRCYCRYTGNDYWVVALQPTASAVYTPLAGYTLVGQFGARGNILHLKKT